MDMFLLGIMGATSWSHCATPVPWAHAQLAILEEIKKNKGE